MDRLKLGLIGGGRMGAVHAEVFAKMAKAEDSISFIAIADNAPGIAERLAKQLGVEKAYESIEEILDDPEIEAVFVATPTFTHYDIVKKVLNKGKHCLCEKPLTLNLDESRELTELAKEKKRILQIGFMRRFDPDVIAAKDSIERGEIGTPLIYKACHRDQSPPPPGFCNPEKSGGIIIDNNIHEFDAGRFLLDDEVTEVFAQPGIVVDEEIGKVGDLDNATVQIRFKNGGIGQIDSSRNSRFGEDIRFELLGSEGTIFWGALPMRGVTIATENGARIPTHLESPDRFVPAFQGQIRTFAQSVRKGKPLGPSGEDSMKALAIGLAAYRSIELGRPVAVSEILE
ncbi:MAG: Gfo/Idh/MocA family oxidoreductase [Ruminococcus sp.]